MSDKFIDYYQLLGVSKDASSDEIKKAYRKMAKRIHPDLNKGDSLSEDKFKLLSEAYSVLSSSSRYDYDKEYQDYYKSKEDSLKKAVSEVEEKTRQDAEDAKVRVKRNARSRTNPYDNVNRHYHYRQEYQPNQHYGRAYAAYSRENYRDRIRNNSWTDGYRKFLEKILNTYNEVRKEDAAYDDFVFRHKKINSEYNHFHVKYVDTIPKEIVFYIGKGVVHVSSEFHYQLHKLSYFNKEPFTKYVIRNRGIATVLAGVMIFGGMGMMYTNKAGADVTPPASEEYFDEEDNYIDEITLMRNYTVQNGDTLSGLAYESNNDIDTILSANNTTSKILYIGDVVNVPYTINREDLKYYTQVVEVDNRSLAEIAKSYETDIATIIRLNPEAIVEVNDSYGIMTDNLVVPNFIAPEDYKQYTGGKTKVLS